MSQNFEAIAEQYMKYVDTNHDGFLSKDELGKFFDFAASKGYVFDKKIFDIDV